jgi:chromosome segregation ATPase
MIRLKQPKKKQCKQCKKEFQPIRPLQQVCDYKCAYELAIVRAELKEKKDWNKRKKELKEELKTPSEYKEDLQKEINHIVRLIDKGHECISSGAKVYQVNAGHLYAVGSHPELRFNLLNIYNQRVHDNKYKGGNGIVYKERIKEVFGLEVFEEIESLKLRYKHLDLSVPEIKSAIKEARKAVRYLEKHTKDLEKPYITEDRIHLRRFYNDLIGIYL